MKLAHFVITRFCLSGGDRLFRACDGPPLDFWSSDPLEPWLVDHRLKLLEAICLPGLRSQTNQDFTWVLLVDADLREDFKARLRNLARARDRVFLHEHRPDAPDRLETLGWLDCLPASRPDYVLTTLNDDDDLLPRRFVEVVRSHAVELDAQGRLPPFKIMGAADRPVGHALHAGCATGMGGPLARKRFRRVSRFQPAVPVPGLRFQRAGPAAFLCDRVFSTSTRPRRSKTSASTGRRSWRQRGMRASG